jgi:hypothetical protein
LAGKVEMNQPNTAMNAGIDEMIMNDGFETADFEAGQVGRLALILESRKCAKTAEKRALWAKVPKFNVRLLPPFAAISHDTNCSRAGPGQRPSKKPVMPHNAA